MDTGGCETNDNKNVVIVYSAFVFNAFCFVILGIALVEQAYAQDLAQDQPPANEMNLPTTPPARLPTDKPATRTTRPVEEPEDVPVTKPATDRSVDESIDEPEVEPVDESVAKKPTAKAKLKIKNTPKELTVNIGGFFKFDTAVFMQDKEALGNGTELRNIRLSFNGKLDKDWDYKLAMDFSDGTSDVTSANVTYDGFKRTEINIGLQKEPFGLENMTSQSNTTFMERAPTKDLTPGRSMGVGIHQRYGDLNYSAGVFGQGFTDDLKDEGDESWGLTGRATYVFPEKNILHLGFSASARPSDDSKTIDFSIRPQAHIVDLQYLDTGNIRNVDSVYRYGLEVAKIYGSISAQMEYVAVHISREAGFKSVAVNGGYAYVSWFLTGEERPYHNRKGAFSSIIPLNKKGAWEVAFRYSWADLNDGSVTGGRGQNLTLGANWYLSEHLKFMLNLISVNNGRHANADGDAVKNDDPKILQIRMQAGF